MASPLVKAFNELRKEGWYCAFCLPCCERCAWGSISDELPDGTPINMKKVLFNHSQDWGLYKKYGETYLSHGCSEELPHAVEVMKKHGCKVRWDGKDNSRIFVETKPKHAAEN